eukprot:Tbor_TRINITY_DN5602_c0_g1::TRINITY_DN5602_c0_g1_i1::g.8216::m.8216
MGCIISSVPIASPVYLVSYATLCKQNDQTSEAVIKYMKGSNDFTRLSRMEGELIKVRDDEDGAKLQCGIDVSIKRGILDANPDVGEVTKIDVLGKSADQISDEILGKLQSKTGNVVILQGLSGTGKGTTAAKLMSHLPNCVNWSNGNVFRSLTHLVSEKIPEGTELTSELISPDLISASMDRLSFKKFQEGGRSVFDLVIDGNTRVSTIQNTLLKRPLISQRVPIVASVTQGEVIKFAASAVQTMKDDGCNIMVEGRAQTLNYMPSPYRFELCMSDINLIGQRRAAQRIMAAALDKLNKSPTPSDEDVSNAIHAAVKSL